MRQPSSTDLLTYGWDLWRTAIAAQATIALRLWSLAQPEKRDSAWGQAELWRMVSEKQAAFFEAGLATQRALLRANPALMPILRAGIRPYKKRTTANARRLGRRF